MTIPREVSFTVAAIFTVACGDAGQRLDPSGDVSHPSAQFLIREIEPAHDVSILQPNIRFSERRGPIVAVAGPIGMLATFGELQAPASHVLGLVKDVVVDRRRRLLILDSLYNNVRVVASGRTVETFGGPGEGPGEFRVPLSISVGDSIVYVGDITRRIHRFRETGNNYEYVDSWRSPVAPTSMCFMDQALWIHGVNAEEKRVVHQVNVNGETVNSFGAVYESPSPIIDYQILNGMIECDEATRTIVYAPAGLLNEVRGFSTTGVVRWITTLAGFRPISLIMRPDGSTRMTVPESGFHRVASLTSIGGGLLVVQVALVTRESRANQDPFDRLYSMILDTYDGNGSAFQADLPELVAYHAEFLVGRTDDPYPQVFILDPIGASP